MNVDNIMCNKLEQRLTIKERILFKLFKSNIIHIYRIGFNDGYYFKQ